MGVACFGPLCLNRASQDFGSITSTPKPNWQNTPVLSHLKGRIDAKKEGFKSGIETDVNAAALLEYHHGNHKEVSESICYITVGTGIGVGLVFHGKPVHGLVHGEGGHMRVAIHPKDKDFEGNCPFHGNCLEGLCSNNAIVKRLGLNNEKDLPALDDENEVWDIIADYLG